MQSSAGDHHWGSWGAWFGTTVGSTCWLAIAAAVLVVKGHPIVALAFALCFLTPCGVALHVWRRRTSIAVNRGLEWWFLTAWVSTATALGVVHLTDTHADINLPGDQVWLMWVGVLAGGAWLWLRIRRRR